MASNKKGIRMVFHSILFEKPEDGPRRDDTPEPAFFGDLNLDQIVSAVTLERDDYKPRCSSTAQDAPAFGMGGEAPLPTGAKASGGSSKRSRCIARHSIPLPVICRWRRPDRKGFVNFIEP
ncbi:MAG: hypothetical protein CBARDCOR_2654 [uncultured Caballeronia sp.]|nr:MAG: hypothetical protein CBARDCOR_2654 [uncultured Caballeronia sp.]